MSRPAVLVTRPEPEASDWAGRLRQHGLAAEALPLIQIAAPRQGLPARIEGDWAALMFVSGNAVQHFMALPGAHEAAARARCWAPGPGTARALRAAGVAATQIDSPPPESGQFDSEHLWALVGPQVRPGKPVLIVRGVDAPADPQAPLPAERAGQGAGREWLAQRLREAGVEPAYLVVYERRPPQPEAAQQARARAAAHDGTVWLFSSSEALRHLRLWLPDGDWRAARALVTHPRIAQAAQQAGFGQVFSCRPTLIDVVASIESLA